MPPCYWRANGMAMKKRQSHPGDAANVFVRVLLSDAGELAGGLSDDEWLETLQYFNDRCAYSGDRITKDSAEQDHAIPINREHCGLHLYGNVLPATKQANRAKGSKHYRDFDLVDAERLRKIEDFMSVAGYHQHAKPFQGLQAYCQSQYEVIKALCKTNKRYLENLLPRDVTEEHLRTLMPNSSKIHTKHDPDGTKAGASSNSPIKDLIVELMAQVDKDGIGLSYQQIASIVCERVVGAHTTARSVACYKTYAHKGQHGITPDQADAILKVTRRH